MKLLYTTKKTELGYANVECLDNVPAMVVCTNTIRDSTAIQNDVLWEKSLLEHNPMDLILANVAAHRQYPDGEKHELASIPNLGHKHHKQKAEEWGCTISNPSLLLICHIYTEMVSNIPCKKSLSTAQRS